MASAKASTSPPATPSVTKENAEAPPSPAATGTSAVVPATSQPATPAAPAAPTVPKDPPPATPSVTKENAEAPPSPAATGTSAVVPATSQPATPAAPAAPTVPKDPPPATPAPSSPAPQGQAPALARAVSALLYARDCLQEAERARGKDDATADAGRLAGAILRFGGAIANEQEPWALKHALERPSGMTDPDGAAALEQLVAVVASSLRLGARRKSLKLSLQPGLITFAQVAVKHANRREAVNELVARQGEDERARQQRNVAQITQLRSQQVRARGPSRPGPSVPVPSSSNEEDYDDEPGDELDAPRVG